MNSHTAHFLNRVLSFVTIIALVLVMVPVWPQIAHADNLFSTSFEGTPPLDEWTSDDPHWGVNASDSRTGSKQAQAVGSNSGAGTLLKEVSTEGYENISLSFWYKQLGMDVGDSITVEWFDGSSWNPVTAINGLELEADDDAVWVEWSGLLGSEADDNTAFAVRFVSNMNSAGNDKFFLEDVNLEGEEEEVVGPVPDCSLTDSVSMTTFDTFATGTVNAQNSWSSTGSYDQEVVPNTYGFEEFGCKSLRISNAVTSGAFGNQTFAAPTAGTAGESSVAANNHFEAEFDIASTMPGLQSGLTLSVSPDDGNGSRMSYLSFTDTADGIDVVFYDVTNTGPLPSVTSWNDTEVATLDRDESHTIKFVMDFVDGPGNDVVKIYIDDVLAHTGTSWEDYYRYDAEQNGNGNALFGVDTLIFRDGGTAVPANDSNGFLFDNMSMSVSDISSGSSTSETIVVSSNTSAGENLPGWMFNRDPGTDTPFVFNTDQSSIGAGSLYVLPIGSSSPSDKFIAENFINAPIADVDSISYDFMIGSGGENTDEEQFYMNVYANFGVSDDNKFYDCRYNIVPTTGSTGGFTTVTFDPNQSYPVTTRTGGSASPFTCPSVPAQMDNLSPGSNIRVFSLNLGDTTVSDEGIDGYFDRVVTVIDDGDNTHTTTYDFDPESEAPTAAVTMCKYNPSEQTMDGWTLMLEGEHIEDVVVPAGAIGGIDTTASLEAGKSYFAVVNGVWLNDRTPDNHVDAEYSTEDSWLTQMDGFTGYGENILDLQVGEEFVEWGPYNSTHTYSASFTPSVDGSVNFRIFDGTGDTPNASWYGDNSGSLSVSIYEGFAGVTDDGCVTFDAVPYGSYEVDEVMQEGWVNTFGLVEVEVDEPTEEFNVVNDEIGEPEMCYVTVVSDESNYVEETEDDAELTWAHPAWTAVIDLAEWIWGTENVEDPTVTEVQTFVKTFEWSGGVASSSLVIATDNFYEVYLNGNFVASSTEASLFTDANKDTIDVSGFIEMGENTLEIKVTNLGVPGSSPTSNPAGLKYNLTVVSDEEGEDCMYAPDEPSLEITKPEIDDMVLAGIYTFEAEYVDADENPDPVQWAIRAGTCNAGTNTVAGNVDGFFSSSTPHTWNGASFSSTIDMSDWDDGEYCFVVNPTEDGGTNFRETRLFTLENAAPTQCLVVSDTSTVVVENNNYAVATWDEHHNWTHDILGATWIWDNLYVVDPEATTTLTFKESFTATDIEEASFEIATDNAYKVFINGVLRYEQSNSNNFQTPDEHEDVLDFLTEGENELLVEVTNFAVEDSIPKTNPAGALFKLDMEVGGVCEITTDLEDESEPQPEIGENEVFGFVWVDDNEDTSKNNDEDYRSGIGISINNGSTTVSTSTDAGGRYFFNIDDGSWTISATTGGEWSLTYPSDNGGEHDVSVSTSSGPYDFGIVENGSTDGGGDGDGDGNGDGDGDGDEGGGTGGGDTTIDSPSGDAGGNPQIAGVTTSGGLFSRGDSGPDEKVLGESTSTEDGTDDSIEESTSTAKALTAMVDWIDECWYWWLLVFAWIVSSGVVYYWKGWSNEPISLMSVELLFSILGLLGLMSYLVFGLHCALWPSLITMLGSAILYYVNNREIPSSKTVL